MSRFIIAMNPRGTKFFKNKKELLYVAPGSEITWKSPCGAVLGRGSRWTKEKAQARRYTTEGRAIAAGRRIASGWFEIQEAK